MGKNKMVNIYGMNILVPCKYENPRRKFTTNLDEELYKYIRTIKDTTKRDISQIMDCMILTMQENQDFFKEFISKLQQY